MKTKNQQNLILALICALSLSFTSIKAQVPGLCGGTCGVENVTTCTVIVKIILVCNSSTCSNYTVSIPPGTTYWVSWPAGCSGATGDFIVDIIDVGGTPYSTGCAGGPVSFTNTGGPGYLGCNPISSSCYANLIASTSLLWQTFPTYWLVTID